MVYGIRYLAHHYIKRHTDKDMNNNNHDITTKYSLSYSLFIIAITILNNGRYRNNYFWLITLVYGVIYALISGIIILHPNSDSMTNTSPLQQYDTTTTPYIEITSYGPTGYVPTMAIHVTDQIGILIIPINLLISILISILVGFNGMITVYVIKRLPKGMRLRTCPSPTIMNFLSSIIGIFAACPTCASFYIFAALMGSIAPTIAAFTATFYTVFLGTSIPLIIGTTVLTLYVIYKTEGQGTYIKKRYCSSTSTRFDQKYNADNNGNNTIDKK